MAASLFCPHCGALNPAGESTCFACGRALAAAAPAAPGAPRVLRQRYRLLRQIGVGGFGAVYKAEDVELGNRLVAVKEMSARGLTPAEVQEATDGFHREALLLARLAHPNLPRIYEQFEEAGRWYLVMDFIEGQTLEDYLAQRGGKLPVKEALVLGLQLTSVLGYLHSRQPPIVFRDLKPSNVIRTPDGQVYLIDFGIARLFKPGQAKDTIAFGSPGYAAPEQYGKAQTTPRSDVFSLGALLHHLLTGVDPSETPFRFKPLTKHHPAGLSTLIERMVDLDTERRPATMELIRQDLERMLNDQSSWLDKDAAQVLPGAYITPASTQATAAYPHLAPSATSWQRPPSAWQGQQALQKTQAGPVLQPTLTRKRRRKGWAGIVVLVIVVWLVVVAASSYNNSSDMTNVNSFPGPSSTSVPVYTLSWSPDGKNIASGGNDGEIEIWDTLSNQEARVLRAAFVQVDALAWSPDSQYLAAAGEDGPVQIWQANGNFVTSYSFGSWVINALSWSSDSRHIIVASNGGPMQVIDALTGNNSAVYLPDSTLVTSLSWSPNGKYIASGESDQIVQVWDTATRKVVYTYQDTSVVNAIAWSPDSKRVASAEADGPVRVWDALTGTTVFTYTEATTFFNALAWSPDGRYLASGSENMTVKVWELGNNAPRFIYTGHKDTVSAVAWSSDSTRIASASYDGTVQIWDALTGANVVSYQQA